MTEQPASPLDPVDQPAIARPETGPVTVVSWQAKVNAVLPSPQAIEAYERSIENAGVIFPDSYRCWVVAEMAV